MIKIQILSKYFSHKFLKVKIPLFKIKIIISTGISEKHFYLFIYIKYSTDK